MKNKNVLFNLNNVLFSAYPKSIGYFVGLENIHHIQVDYGSGVFVEARYVPLPEVSPELKTPYLVLIDEIGMTGSPQTERTRLLLMYDMKRHPDCELGTTKNLIPYAEILVRSVRFSGKREVDGAWGTSFDMEVIVSKPGYQSLILDTDPMSRALLNHFLTLTQQADSLAHDFTKEWVTSVFAPEGKGYDEWIPTHVNFKALVPVS